jgi:hypothetical protein
VPVFYLAFDDLAAWLSAKLWRKKPARELEAIAPSRRDPATA